MKPITIFRWLTGITAALTALAAWELGTVLDAAGILEYPVWLTRWFFLHQIV